MPPVAFDLGVVATGALGGVLSWYLTDFVGRPVRRFRELKAEIIRCKVVIANVPSRWKERPTGDFEAVQISDADDARLSEAIAKTRDLAGQVQGFIYTDAVATWLLERVAGYDLQLLTRSLLGFSNSREAYGRGRHVHELGIDKALKLSKS